jgi:hypothetical protein
MLRAEVAIGSGPDCDAGDANCVGGYISIAGFPPLEQLTITYDNIDVGGASSFTLTTDSSGSASFVVGFTRSLSTST